MTDWREVAARLEANIVDVERALQAESWEELRELRFCTPETPAELPEGANQAELQGLLERSEAVREQLRSHITRLQNELDGLDLRRRAARAYVDGDRG